MDGPNEISNQSVQPTKSSTKPLGSQKPGEDKEARIAELENRCTEILNQLEKLWNKDPRRLRLEADIRKLKEAIFGRESGWVTTANPVNFMTRTTYRDPGAEPTDPDGNLMPSLQLREKQYKELTAKIEPKVKELKEEYRKNIKTIRQLKVDLGEIEESAPTRSQFKLLDTLYPTEK